MDEMQIKLEEANAFLEPSEGVLKIKHQSARPKSN